jgi:hypothetical protein
VALGACWALATPPSARAQGSWDATLLVAPFPSPYLSDWETNPTIATYTLVNGTGTAQDAILYYEVRNQAGTIVTSGRSDPQAVSPGAPLVYTSFSDIAGSTQHDAALEDQVTRSGRMPEGDYTACVVAASRGGFVLARVCETFTIVYPDPPMLIAPADGDLVQAASPIFQWTPLQVPGDYALHFVLQVAEVRPGQTPYTALTANILHYENLDVGATSLVYPVDGLTLNSGSTYAWRVVAMDQNGYAAATNGGSSEVWTFRYDDGGGDDESSTTSRLTLGLRNDGGESLSGAPEDDPTTGLLQICSEWDATRPLTQITLPVASKILFPDSATVPGALTRRELPGGHRVWAVAGANASYTFLAYGDCDGLLDRTVLRWVGARKLSDSQELMGWLQGEDVAADPEGSKVKFGVGIFSLFDMTATGDSLDVVNQFLEGYSIDVQPGFNGFWIFDGSGSPKLQRIAEILHTTTSEFELQGFVGLNQSFSVGVSAGTKPGAAGPSPAYREGGLGADVSLERTFFVARGALPAWKKPWGSERLASIQLGIEIVIKDSTVLAGAGLGKNDAAFDVVITPTITVVTADDVTWKGAIGVDLAKGSWVDWDPKLVVKLVTDKTWQPGPLAGTQFAIGNLEAELDVDEGLIAAFSKGPGAIDWSLAIGGSLGWANQPALAKLGVAFGRKADNPEKYWTDMVATDSAQAQAELLLIQISRERLDRAEAAGNAADIETARAELDHRSKLLDETLQRLRTSQRGLDLWKQAAAGGKPALTNNEKGAWWWRARISLGNLSLLDLLDLFRKASVAIRDRTQGSP